AGGGGGGARGRGGPGAPGRGWARHLRRGVAVLAAVGLGAFAVVLARPASTEPIAGPDGRPLAGSIAELTTIPVGGKRLGVMIRGQSTNNPVVLFLPGGPGGSERGAMRKHLPGLEKHFTVVTWDQRGAGTSYPALDPTSTYTLNSSVADTIAMTNYLRERFGQNKIYLLGNSWGTVVGVLAAQQEPQLYAAYIGTGQMVDPLQTDRIFYNDTLAWARKNDNTTLADRLTAIGPPPYRDMLDYETALAHEHEVYPYDHTGNSEGAGGYSENFIVPEYAVIDQVHLLGSFMDTFAVLYPQVQDLDFRTDANTLSVPAYFVEGAHEARGRTEPFQQWYAALSSPHKELAVLSTSGHRPLFEQPQEFVAFMTDTVLAQTAQAPQ
ncbi:MAG: alpha/beta hydrolase, partial [Humibacillus sp.]|nr:alpha/beta hydrolase [Humibacillus sp.]